MLNAWIFCDAIAALNNCAVGLTRDYTLES